MAHHYVLRVTERQPTQTEQYLIQYTHEDENHAIVGIINMTVPRTGNYENSNRELTDAEAEELAGQVLEVLNLFFQNGEHPIEQAYHIQTGEAPTSPRSRKTK